ncbi:MAG: hypothetical protein WAO83_07420, partial [Fuerstiella sp.]
RKASLTPRREPPTTLPRGPSTNRALHFSPAKRHTFPPPFTHDNKGRRVFTETVFLGKDHGLAVQHWPSGPVYSVRFSSHGTQQGRRLAYFETGELYSGIEMRDGVAQGTHATFYRTGETFTVVNNVNGRPDGKRLHHLPDGTVYGVTEFENGREVNSRALREISPAEYELTVTNTIDPVDIWASK